MRNYVATQLNIIHQYMPRVKRIDPDESKRTSISLRKETLAAVKRRAIDLDVSDNAVLEVAVERYIVSDLERSRACPVCKSVSYASCSHVEIREIGDSVLKTEQSFTRGLTLGEDEYSLLETWRRARDVGFTEWKEMLLSIRRQMELVARAADREKELLALAEREARG